MLRYPLLFFFNVLIKRKSREANLAIKIPKKKKKRKEKELLGF